MMMRVDGLIEASAGAVALAAGQGSMQVRGIVDDSRRTGPGVLFVARPGSAGDGLAYVDDAWRRGAAGVLAGRPVAAPAGRVALVAEDPLAAGARLAAALHGDPARSLRLIGITGTNGKTTTAFLVRHLLAAGGRRCGLMGTIEIDTGDERRPADLTTPGRLELIELLGRMVRGGCETAVMEVSSHALYQGRVDGLGFDVGVFTNLSGDHLDYHRTMEAYAAAKARLMAMLPADGTAVVNGDDAYHEQMLGACHAKVVRYHAEAAADASPPPPAAAGGNPRTVRAHSIIGASDGTEATFTGPWGALAARMPLIGRHNVANMLAALSVAHAMGVDVKSLGEAVAACPQVPGRLERVVHGSATFEVIVDYAHTDDALANVLRALRPITAGRLRVVFGCGGDRDQEKRPRMAKRACVLADAVMVTSDNPRTEDAQRIIEQILAGVPAEARGRVAVEADRRAAIERAVAEAEPDDVVLIAGKGHEDYQLVGDQRLAFDDRQVAREALEERAARATRRGASVATVADRTERA